MNVLFFSTYWLAMMLPADNQLSKYWYLSFDELHSRSDLVVVASILSTDHVSPDDGRQAFLESDRETKNGNYALINCRCQIESTLKGSVDSDVLTFVCCQLNESPDSNEKPVFRGPSLIELKKAVVKDLKLNHPFLDPKCLLFLRRTEDGRLIPVSGQDQASYSVWHLSRFQSIPAQSGVTEVPEPHEKKP